MKTGLFHTLCLSTAFLFVGSSNLMASVQPEPVQTLAKKKTDNASGKHTGQHKISFILKHAADVNLTADQVTKIKALQGQTTTKKEVKQQLKSILTKDQRTQLKALHHKHKKKN